MPTNWQNAASWFWCRMPSTSVRNVWTRGRSQTASPPILPDWKAGSEAYIRAFNAFANRHEELTAKTIFAAGATWPGILFQGDRASLDYLLTRPEVDSSRIGCMGLSIRGLPVRPSLCP